MQFIARLLVEDPSIAPLTFKLFKVDEDLFYAKPIEKDRPELHFGIIEGHIQLIASSTTKPVPNFIQQKFIRRIAAYVQAARNLLK
jgi:hypothetical protein